MLVTGDISELKFCTEVVTFIIGGCDNQITGDIQSLSECKRLAHVNLSDCYQITGSIDLSQSICAGFCN